MKKSPCILVLVCMLIMCTLISCSKNNEGESENEEVENRITDEEDESFMVSLTAINYTTDGYFDGVLYYQITSNLDNTVEVTKGSRGISVVKIPKYVIINGTTYSVTSIHSEAFQQCENLSSVIISDNIVSIGENAFEGIQNLDSIVFGKNVMTIGYNAFSGCPISKIEFADGESLGRIMCKRGWRDTIYETWLMQKLYGGRVPTYDNDIHLFIQGKEVHDIIIPTSVTSIDECAFVGCNNLNSVTIFDGVKEVGFGAFYGCSNLTSLTISNSVTKIDPYAFYQCSSLNSLTIHGNITYIGEYAFGFCQRLTSLTIDGDATGIDELAFGGCSGLESVNIDIKDLSRWCISNCNIFMNYSYAINLSLNGEIIRSLIIPNAVTSISDFVFHNCSGLTSLTIPNSVTSIGESAFEGCSGLTSLTIPNSVTSIGSYAFGGCSGLTSVTIPNSVTSIGSSAFYGCSGLTSLTIPNSVTSIGTGAFAGCTNVSSITICASIPPTIYYSFDGRDDCLIYVPSGSVEAYRNAEGWEYCADRIRGF